MVSWNCRMFTRVRGTTSRCSVREWTIAQYRLMSAEDIRLALVTELEEWKTPHDVMIDECLS
ncbi:hypothetical protein RDV32_RS27245, partial [Escherichia coli]